MASEDTTHPLIGSMNELRRIASDCGISETKLALYGEPILSLIDAILTENRREIRELRFRLDAVVNAMRHTKDTYNALY